MVAVCVIDEHRARKRPGARSGVTAAQMEVDCQLEVCQVSEKFDPRARIEIERGSVMPPGALAGQGGRAGSGGQRRKAAREPLPRGVGTWGITASDDEYYSQLDMEVDHMNHRAWRHPWRWAEYPAIYRALTFAAMLLREAGPVHGSRWVPITIEERCGQAGFWGGDLIVRGCCGLGVGDFGTEFLGQYKSGILVEVMREHRATLPPQPLPNLTVFDRPEWAERAGLVD